MHSSVLGISILSCSESEDSSSLEVSSPAGFNVLLDAPSLDDISSDDESIHSGAAQTCFNSVNLFRDTQSPPMPIALPSLTLIKAFLFRRLL